MSCVDHFQCWDLTRRSTSDDRIPLGGVFQSSVLQRTVFVAVISEDQMGCKGLIPLFTIPT